MEIDKIKTEIKEEPNDEFDTLAMLVDPAISAPEIVVFKIEEIGTDEPVEVTMPEYQGNESQQFQPIPGPSQKRKSLTYITSIPKIWFTMMMIS